jgi:hypothetical protein
MSSHTTFLHTAVVDQSVVDIAIALSHGHTQLPWPDAPGAHLFSGDAIEHDEKYALKSRSSDHDSPPPRRAPAVAIVDAGAFGHDMDLLDDAPRARAEGAHTHASRLSPHSRRARLSFV